VRINFRITLLLALTLTGSANAWGLEDPTRPPEARTPGVQVAPVRNLELGSILLGGDRRVVVIEGKALQEGDRHNGIQVRRIYRNKVEIVDQGQARVLYPEALPQVRKSQ